MNLNMNSSSRQKLQSCSITRGVLVFKTGIYGIRCQNLLLVLLSPFSKQFDPLLFLRHTLLKTFLGRFAYSLMKLTSDCINSSSLTLVLKSAPSGYDMSPFIRRYAKYLSEKSTAYRFIFLIRALALFLRWNTQISLADKVLFKGYLCLISNYIHCWNGAWIYLQQIAERIQESFWGIIYNFFLSTLYFHALVMLLISEVYSENFESHPDHWDGNINNLDYCLELSILFQYKLKFPIFCTSGRRHLTSAK